MSAPTEPQHSILASHLAAANDRGVHNVLFAPSDELDRMPDGDHLSVAFVKGGKRKRLSKVRVRSHTTPVTRSHPLGLRCMP